MDNLCLFNRLTHDNNDHGLVDRKVFDKLIYSFDDYNLIKNVVENMDIKFVDKASVDDDKIVFSINLPNKKLANKVILNLPEDIEYHGKKFNLVSFLNGNCVNIYFNRN